MSTAEAITAFERHDGLPSPRRMLAFLTVLLGTTIAVLDGTIVNVALPTIAADQHANPADAIWIITCYQLAVMVFLLPLSSLGEAIGFKKVYIGGLAVFAVASALCAYSPSLFMLALARVLQGAAGAALMSTNSALIRFILPAKMLGRGIGVQALVVAVAAAAGPTIAAGILAIASWHWLFLINIPLGIGAVLVGRITLPATPATGARLDVVSAVLNAATFGFFISGLSSIGNVGTPLWLIAAQLIIAVIAGVLLTLRQLPRAAPLFPVDLLRVPAFRLSIAASLCSFAAQFLAVVSLPFFFNHALGFSAVNTGLLMTPWPVATAATALIAGRLSDRLPAPRLSGVGSLVFGLGLISLALLPTHPGALDIVWRLALTGLGFGFFQSPNNKVMVSSAPRHRSGSAGGMLATARLLGQSAGAAIAAIIFGLSASYNLPLTMGIAAALALVAAVISIWR